MNDLQSCPIIIGAVQYTQFKETQNPLDPRSSMMIKLALII